MAVYRTVQVSFWTDPKVDDDFTPEDKYFYLYLLTNPHANICGCYEISMKQMVRETGYNEDTVKRLLDRLNKVHGVIQYDTGTKEVFIQNWHKYNWANSPKTIAGAIAVAKNVKSVLFLRELNKILIGYGYPMDTLSIQSQYPMDTSVTVPVTDTVSVTDSDTDSVTSTTPSTEQESNTVSLLDTFCSEYPSVVNQAAVKRVWESMNLDSEFNDIMDGLRKWKESEQWEDKRYIPYAENFLAKQRWKSPPAQTDRLSHLREMYRAEMEKKNGQG